MGGLPGDDVLKGQVIAHVGSLTTKGIPSDVAFGNVFKSK